MSLEYRLSRNTYVFYIWLQIIEFVSKWLVHLFFRHHYSSVVFSIFIHKNETAEEKDLLWNLMRKITVQQRRGIKMRATGTCIIH